MLSGDCEQICFREVEERVDNLGYIIELKGKLKYHLFPECEGLSKGFRNFFMPEPVQNIKDEETKKQVAEDVRNWFKTNNYSIDKYLKGEINDKTLTIAFNSYFPAKYKIDPITISESEKNQFQWYIEKKSDSVKIEKEFSMIDFEKNVSNIIKERNNLCKHSIPLYNLSKFDYLHNKDINEIQDKLKESIDKNYLKEANRDYLENMGWENIVGFWKAHLELKYRARNEFVTLLKWKFNLKQIELQNIQLEDFNFEVCSMCSKLQNNII